MATKMVVLTALLLIFPSIPLRAQVRPVLSTWDGVYTSGQAARGKQQYDASCASCHSEDLSGGEARPLIGTRFWEAWGEDSLGSLLGLINTTMPRTGPGSLSRQAYLDIVAYILQKNDYPPGADELTMDRVDTIRVMRKEGPGPVPNFALVAVVGCLSRQPRGAWVLTAGSEPVRIRNPEPSVGPDRERAQATAAGSNTFELMNAHQAESHAGQRLEVKGLLIRGAPDRLNVTSMQTIADRCDQ
jgi:mono/diheme cytochrome c family protein